MRHRLAILLTLLPLAACGGGRDAGEETFRRDYRARNVPACQTNFRAEFVRAGNWNESMTPGVQAICACAVERTLNAHSIAELQSQMDRTTWTPAELAAQRAILRQCTQAYVDRTGGGTATAPPPPAGQPPNAAAPH